MDDTAEYIDQFIKVPGGRSTSYTTPPTCQPDTQPVYIEQPSAQPVYMAQNQSRNQSSTSVSMCLPSPPPNDNDDAYENPTGWVPKSGQSPVVEDMYDNPDMNLPKPEVDQTRSRSPPSPHSVAGSNNMYMSLDQNSRERNVYASTSSVQSPPNDSELYESLNNGHLSSVQQTADDDNYSTINQSNPTAYLDVLPSQDRLLPSEEDNYYIT